MSGDIDKILSELSKMQIPQFFGSLGKTKFAENVTTSDAIRYQIGTPPIFQQFPEGPVITSEKMKVKSRYVDSQSTADAVRIKSRSGDLVLLTDTLKLERERSPDTSGTSETVRYRIGIMDSAATSDLLKSIKVILTDSILVTDKLKGSNAFGDSLSTSDLTSFKLKVPESVTTSDLMKQGIAFKQVFTDTATISDLLAKIKEVLQDSPTIADQARFKWTLADSASTSDLVKLTFKTPDTLTTSDVLKKLTLKTPESPNIIDVAKTVQPLKSPDSAGTSETYKITMNLGTGATAEVEATTDAQSSYIIPNSLLNGSFDANLTSWTTVSSAGGIIAQVATPAQFGAGACKVDGTAAITATAYATQQFTNITAGIVYLNWWVYPSSYGVVGFNGGHSVNLRDNAATTYCFTIHPASDGIYIGNVGSNAGNWISFPGISPLSINTWHHFNVLYDITNKILKVYLDGLSVYTVQNITTQSAGFVSFGDLATNVLAGLAYYDEFCVGLVTTQGTSLITGASPAPVIQALSFDTQTGYDSPGSSSGSSSWQGGGTRGVFPI